MRLLKFRVWNEWEHKMEIPDNIANGIDGNKYQVMQFTGLFDKQGKEIYEGDILGGIWAGGWIVWCEKCKSFEYFINGFGCASCEGDIYWQEVIEDEKRLEVTGNIYQNPELLEVVL